MTCYTGSASDGWKEKISKSSQQFRVDRDKCWKVVNMELLRNIELMANPSAE